MTNDEKIISILKRDNKLLFEALVDLATTVIGHLESKDNAAIIEDSIFYVFDSIKDNVRSV